MRIQLFLLGAVVALTVGALTVAGSVPSTTISAVPSSPGAHSQPAARAPAAEPVAIPSAVADTTPADTTTIADTAPAAPLAGTVGVAQAPTAASGACSGAFQLIQKKAKGRKKAVAPVIAGCLNQSGGGTGGQTGG